MGSRCRCFGARTACRQMRLHPSPPPSRRKHPARRPLQGDLRLPQRVPERNDAAVAVLRGCQASRRGPAPAGAGRWAHGRDASQPARQAGWAQPAAVPLPYPADTPLLYTPEGAPLFEFPEDMVDAGACVRVDDAQSRCPRSGALVDCLIDRSGGGAAPVVPACCTCLGAAVVCPPPPPPPPRPHRACLPACRPAWLPPRLACLQLLSCLRSPVPAQASRPRTSTTASPVSWRPDVVRGLFPQKGGRVRMAPSPQALLTALYALPPELATDLKCVGGRGGASRGAAQDVACARLGGHRAMAAPTPSELLTSPSSRHVIYDVAVPLFNMQHLFGIYTPLAQPLLLTGDASTARRERRLRKLLPLLVTNATRGASPAARALGPPGGAPCRLRAARAGRPRQRLSLFQGTVCG